MVTNAWPGSLPIAIVELPCRHFLKGRAGVSRLHNEPELGPAVLYVPGATSVPTTKVPSSEIVVAGPLGVLVGASGLGAPG